MFNNLHHHLVNLGMAINTTKTQLLIFNPDKQGKQITIDANGTPIGHQKTLRVLGFNFSEDAKMDQQIWKGEINM